MAFRLHIAGFAGMTQPLLESLLQQYAHTHNHTLVPIQGTAHDFNIVAVIEAPATMVSVLIRWPAWWEVVEYLRTAVLTPFLVFHFYEDDFWMYNFYIDGTLVDSFDSVPGLRTDPTIEHPPSSGNPRILCQYWPSLTEALIVPYYEQWDSWDGVDPTLLTRKALPHDHYPCGNAWQFSDFMRSVGLPIPLREDGTVVGTTYAFQAQFPRVQTGD